MMDNLSDEPKSKRLKKSNDELLKQEKNGTNNSVIPPKSIKIGSRKSQLALFQSNFVLNELKKRHPELKYEIITVQTTGDRIQNIPLAKIGEKSLFTKELETALENHEVDIVVHSLKDLPTSLPPNMVIGAICKRENPFDAVVFRDGYEYTNLNSLPKGSVVGTSSLRRIAQLKKAFPHLEFKSVRGNVNTRIRKLDEDNVYDALILATAGLKRMDLESRISYILKKDICMHAVGQGAIAIECRAKDQFILNLISETADSNTTLCCIAERSFMKRLEGGCSVPVAVVSKLDNKELTLEGGVFSLDGSKYIIEQLKKTLNETKLDDKSFSQKEQEFCGIVALHLERKYLIDAESIGFELAGLLLEKGAEHILKEARAANALS